MITTKMLRNFVLFFALFFCANVAAAQASFTLEQAVEYGINNSTKMRNIELDQADADFQIKETAAIGYPQLNGQIGLSRYLQIPKSIIDNTKFPGFDQSMLPPPYNTTPVEDLPAEFRYSEFTAGVKNTLSGQLDLQMLLFDRTYLIGLQAARQLKVLVGSQVAATEVEITNNIRQAYVATLIIDETKQTLLNNITNIDKTLFETRALNQAGFVEALDLERLELSRSNLDVELDKLEDQRGLLYNVLKYQMSYPVDKDIVLTDDVNTLLLDALEVDFSENIDVSQRPEFQIFQERYKINEYNLERIRAAYYPNLVGFASYGLNLSRDRLFRDKDIGWIPTSLVGLQVNVPIFDGFKTKNSLERARITVEKIKNEEVELKRALELQAQNAKIEYKTALQSIATAKKKASAAASKPFKLNAMSTPPKPIIIMQFIALSLPNPVWTMLLEKDNVTQTFLSVKPVQKLRQYIILFFINKINNEKDIITLNRPFNGIVWRGRKRVGHRYCYRFTDSQN